MEMRLLNPKYREPGQMARFQEDLMEAVRAVPGVEAASMTSAVPMRGVDFLYSVGGGAHKRSVDSGYFGLMRIPLRAGRLFSLEDSAASEPVAVVSESLGRNLFGEEDPIGRVMDTGNPIPLRIVGVVGDVRTTGLSEPPRPAFYVPRAQEPMELICLVIRSTPGAAGVPAAVQDVIHSIDPEQPVEGITTLDAIVARQTSHRRSYTTATLAFGLAALGMSMTGLMGMVSRMVSERRKDIAIRMAVGAGRARVLGMVVGNGMMPAAAGVLAGLAAAIPIARFLDLFLFEVTPLDPWTYAGVAATVLVGAVIACYVPARRATRLDPMATLRTD
jgi:predicted permease